MMMPAGDGGLGVLEQMRRVTPEELALPLLWQLAVIVACARMMAWVARRIGQPGVVGEVASGLMLGPSVLGWLAPGVYQAVARPLVGELSPEASDLVLSKVLMALAQVGMVLVLFLIGLELDFSHLVAGSKATAAVAVLGAAVPFAVGAGLGWVMHPLVEARASRLAFCLFLGTAFSVTALPVLGRMLREWGVTQTRLAALVMSAAAFQDVLGWVLLAVVAAAVGGQGEGGWWRPVGMLVGALMFTALLIGVVRPMAGRLGRNLLRGGELGVSGLAALLVALFGCVMVTGVIGNLTALGAFLLGAALSGERELAEAAERRLEGVVEAFFLPIFFAYTGMRMDVRAVSGWWAWGLAASACLLAVVGKVGGCLVAMRWSGRGWREGWLVGALMNTRGLMELVVANVGLGLGVIPESVYCMLVMMALVTTVMTAPLVALLAPGTEMGEAMRATRDHGDDARPCQQGPRSENRS
jgi:Kef-type K+ transport system membrane component KefB